MTFLIEAVLFAGFTDSFQPAVVTLAVRIVVSNCTAPKSMKKPDLFGRCWLFKGCCVADQLIRCEFNQRLGILVLSEC